MHCVLRVLLALKINTDIYETKTQCQSWLLEFVALLETTSMALRQIIHASHTFFALSLTFMNK
jgi:hypothetical protein